MSYSERYGREVVASRDFAVGEVLMRENPIAIAPHNVSFFHDATLEHPVVVSPCGLPSCFRPLRNATVVCDGCFWTQYCSERCRDADRPVHARMCCARLLMSPKLALAARVLASGVRFDHRLFSKAPLQALGTSTIELLRSELVPRFTTATRTQADVVRTALVVAGNAFHLHTFVTRRIYGTAFYTLARLLNHSVRIGVRFV